MTLTEIEALAQTFIAKSPEWRDDVDLLVAPPQGQECLDTYPELNGSDAIKPLYTSYGVPRISLYFRLRRLGESHKLAEMVACQSGPALNTDSTFFRGMKMLGDQFGDDRQLNNVMRMAKRQGYTPSAGDVYQPGLARFQGDPEAFVGPSQGRGYIKRLCESRGWACEGAVKTPYREPEKDPRESDIPLAEDLIKQDIAKAIRADPSLRRTSRGELREKVVRRHGPSDVKGIEP